VGEAWPRIRSAAGAGLVVGIEFQTMTRLLPVSATISFVPATMSERGALSALAA
jgi:hypothetical protein